MDVSEDSKIQIKNAWISTSNCIVVILFFFNDSWEGCNIATMSQQMWVQMMLMSKATHANVALQLRGLTALYTHVSLKRYMPFVRSTTHVANITFLLQISLMTWRNWKRHICLLRFFCWCGSFKAGVRNSVESCKQNNQFQIRPVIQLENCFIRKTKVQASAKLIIL